VKGGLVVSMSDGSNVYYNTTSLTFQRIVNTDSMIEAPKACPFSS